jgi:hypothetical protein
MGGGGGGGAAAAAEQLKMQKEETLKLAADADATKIKLAEELAAKRKTRLTGGSRSLLSAERLNAETGIASETLGASIK